MRVIDHIRATVIGAILFGAFWVAPITAETLGPDDYCLELLDAEPVLAKKNYELTRRDVPKSVPGLAPKISIPSEGELRLHDLVNGRTRDAWSPAGDHTFVPDLYDPKSGRLYVWGYFENGWIEVLNNGSIWSFGEKDLVRPKLYDPPHDVEDVVRIHRSEALGLLFYYGYTAPHWLTGRQDFRFYKIDGQQMHRIPQAEEQVLSYRGDDPVAGMAVFARATGNPASSALSHQLIWYDGNRIVEPDGEGHGPLYFFRDDPAGPGRFLRDSRALLHHWDGEVLTSLFDKNAPPGPTTWPFYRASLDRWVIASRKEWFEYNPGQRLKPLKMPAGVVNSHAWLLDPVAGYDRWITNSRELWWEMQMGADLIVRLPERWRIASPAFVGAIKDGAGLGLRVESAGINRKGYWFALTRRREQAQCLHPGTLADQIPK